ncbi:zonular occludens toxin domain-containing protein [Oceanobacter sp. 3_MG-2023]|uniref:zonular occludens toxin domain-containing protein n=1 Tax=Oceanobacter sp. 3_MG-2023 TaxID=3062622 RepID=UPI00273748E2|nr:zonular occludens toxin domain-containing protein [Oceanobacter sp. 3_MG-2023]MDP2506712.1 zonular occludens toxin domain-containing protein [Oceanobacter sp. 3_MG-2023]
MAFYFLTGKLGSGKSLVAIARIREKLALGCPVATNIDLNLLDLTKNKYNKSVCVRLPDKPSVFDLESLGNGNTTYDELKNGLIVLDECGTWFNARNWNDKSRKPVNDWFLHARKLGWDVILIVQDISIIDSQARDALSEFTVFCRRMDNFSIPLIGGLYKFLVGSRLKMPKIHVGKVVCGQSISDPVSDRWVYRGHDLYSAYDTKQAFLSDYPHGVHCVLPPFYKFDRIKAKKDWGFIVRLTKIYLRRFSVPVSAVYGGLFGIFAAYMMTLYVNNQFFDEYKRLAETIKKAEQVQQMQEQEQSGLTGVMPAAALVLPLPEFSRYQIVGYSQVNEARAYDLALRGQSKQPVGGAEGDSGALDIQTLSTAEIAGSFDVQPVSPCHVRISNGPDYADVFCF